MAEVQVLNISGVGATEHLQVGARVEANWHCEVPELRSMLLTVVAIPSRLEPDRRTAQNRIDVFCVVGGKPRVHAIQLRGLETWGWKPEPPQEGMFVITWLENSKGLGVKLATIDRSWLDCRCNMPPKRLLEVKFGEKEPTCQVELGRDVVLVPVPESFAAQCRM